MNKHVVNLSTGAVTLMPLTAYEEGQRIVDAEHAAEKRAERELEEKHAAALRAASEKYLESLKDDPNAPQEVKDYHAANP